MTLPLGGRRATRKRLPRCQHPNIDYAISVQHAWTLDIFCPTCKSRLLFTDALLYRGVLNTREAADTLRVLMRENIRRDGATAHVKIYTPAHYIGNVKP
jgi:hypothetical protein